MASSTANTDYTQLFIYRITHRDNIPYLLEKGICSSNSLNVSPSYVNIGHKEVIEKRNATPVRIDGYGVLHDYVSFYFTPHSVMLYNIKTGYGNVEQRPQNEIVILQASIMCVIASGQRFFFTDGQGNARITKHLANPTDLDKIDWPLIRKRDFKNEPQDMDKRRRYQAEFHVHGCVPVSCIHKIVAYDTETTTFVEREVNKNGLSIPVQEDTKYYF